MGELLRLDQRVSLDRATLFLNAGWVSSKDYEAYFIERMDMKDLVLPAVQDTEKP